MSDLDLLRAAVVDRNLVGVASGHLTETIAMQLPFEALGPFKTSLKRFFSRQPWTDEDAVALSDLVTEHVSEGHWTHDLDGEFTLVHGITDDGRYEITIGGTAEASESIFDRVFSGPVVPVQTPHPRKVKFVVGGDPAPGRWYRRGDETGDVRVTAMFEDPEVTDVMVAGDFVTVGLDRTASWEERLDDVLVRVTDLFWDEDAEASGDVRTREELMEEGRSLEIADVRPTDLHLMDPDRDDHRETLVGALGADDGRLRRAAVATLAMSDDAAVVKAAIVTGYNDSSRLVRRTAVDSAADLEDDEFRPLFEDAAVHDEDAWIRWKSVRALTEIGPGPSEESLILAAADEDFRVRFEAQTALRET
ncbi:MAG: HEAT repeat domain-containing protein [Acidimicrobiia bacterium]|nr:HEAT repeat domain-containing protein [Acidimicrobiia bacterium]